MLTYMDSRKCIRTYTCTNIHKVIDANFPTYHPRHTGHTRRRDHTQEWAGTTPAIMLANLNVINIPYQHAMLELYSLLLYLHDNRMIIKIIKKFLKKKFAPRVPFIFVVKK
jgi:hypothetical protein